MTPQERADKSAKALWENDKASHWAGFERGTVREGYAEIHLLITEHHCNGHGIGHGGVTFMLADTAFAFACNSRNQNTVAMHNTISYIAAVRLGDRLTAKAQEVTLNGRNGIYDVLVVNQNGDTVATFRGASRAIKGQLFNEEAPS